MTSESMDLSSFFEQTNVDAQAVTSYADAVHTSFQSRERFEILLGEYRTKVAQGQGDPFRLGLGLLMVSRFSDALEQLAQAAPSAARDYYAAEAALGLGRLDPARESFERAGKAGWDGFDVDMRVGEVHLRAGDLSAAEKLVKKHESHGQDRADWYHLRAMLAEAREERSVAAEAYERALVLNPDHVPALFRAARLYDQVGDDEAALELYNRLTRKPRAHVNALINAAVIFEDIGRYGEAVQCLRRVLKAYPNHTRARLFLKDVLSCQEMVIDEHGDDRADARTRLLDMSLSEFELSVRARNCLKKMNIRTIGELIQLSEPELLAYKNFGETSLNEIKALLDKKNLRLGQRPDEVDMTVAEPTVVPKAPPLPPGQEAVLAKPVSELELSVRARRCLQRLNVASLGDLVQYTEQDLLATRNFGVTSLNEVKSRLNEHGLQLATKKPG